MNTPESWALAVTIFKDALVAISALGAVIVAFRGLSAWRSEMKGKTEYQLAKDVLKAAYRVRDAFARVRNPFMLNFELPEGSLDQHGQLKPDQLYEGRSHAYANRSKHIDDAFEILEELHLDAQVEWGPSVSSKIDSLRRCRSEIHVEVRIMLERLNPDAEPWARTDEERRRANSIIYAGGTKKNPNSFDPEIEAAVNAFETWLRPYIRR